MAVFMQHPLSLSWHNWRRYCARHDVVFTEVQLMTAALGVLMGEPGLRDLMIRAIAAATQRSRELAK